MTRSDVLIIGAGPTGLVLALWLTKLGVKVRIVDKSAESGTTSRALAVQARTLELYRELDSPTRYSSAVTRRPPLIYGSEASGLLAYRSRK
jgi:2-polyprenyl-6-methoxyphenol hydroxylase-like FAD-dependent oxidoreductase